LFRWQSHQWYQSAVLALCTFTLQSVLCAQQTVVQDAGPGLKQEIDHDSAGRIVEIRTIYSDGRLQGKVNNTFNRRNEVEVQTSTSYWPDGKSVHKVSEERFDQNFNFTSETVAGFDQAGKHISGHKLLHNPMTGVYRCFDWNAALQNYKPRDCPASEESREGPSEVRRVTRDEVMQSLAAARATALAAEKSKSLQPKAALEAASSKMKQDIGLVLPAQLRPGQRVSGSLVLDPDRFADEPDLTVTRISLPFSSAADASNLRSLMFELKGAAPQPAEESISFDVPVRGPIEFTLKQGNDPSVATSGKVTIGASTAATAVIASGYKSPALCFKRGLCLVTGRFNGNSHDTFAAFDKAPARIVAETDSAAYVEVPSDAIEGQTALIVAEGNSIAAMMMVVAEYSLAPNRIAIEPGQDRLSYLRLNSISELSNEQWRYGVYPGSNLQKARALLPGFNPAKAVEQAREEQERQDRHDGYSMKGEDKDASAGMVLVVVRNQTPGLVTLRGSEHDQYVFTLTPDSFSRGDYKLSFALDASRSGTYALKAVAIPFLAPITAQVFDNTAAMKK